MEVGNHPLREGAHSSREGWEPVHQGRGGGPHQERRPFVKGRRRPFYLTHRRRLFVEKRPFVKRGGHLSRKGGTIR